MKRLRSLIQAFLVALLATTLMVVIRRWVFVALFDFSAPAMPAILAIMLAAWFGGLTAGLIAVALNGALLVLLVNRGVDFNPFEVQRVFRLLVFAISGSLISWGIQSLHTSRRRLEGRQRELESEMRRREGVEFALREQEERVRLAVEAANIGTWDFNPVTGEQNWSARAKTMFGIELDADVKGISFRDRVHPEDRERVNLAIQKALDPSGDGVYDVDCRLVWPDGSVHWFIAKGQALFEVAAPNRRAVRLIGTAFDITERKQAEEAVRSSQSRLEAIMDNTSAVIYLKDANGQYLMINKRYEELFNITQEQIAGKTDADLFPRDVVTQLNANDRQVRDSGQSLEFEEIVPHGDGPHTYFTVKFPIRDAQGVVVAVGGISTDISDRKAVEEVVRASEIRLRGILDNVPAVISLKDLQGRYVLVNRGWEDLFGVRNDDITGLTNEELLSKTLSAHMSREIADQFEKIDKEVIRTGEPIEFEDPMPYGDDLRIFATVKFPMKDASGRLTGIGGISLDVTERRKAIDALASEQDLLRHTIEVQDHERQVIAYEIHDGLIQYVTGALMQVEALRSSNDAEPTAKIVENIEGILRRAVAEGRQLMNGIRTPVLDNFGVVAAVEQLIEDEERAHVQVEFIKDDDLERMDPKTEEAIFRITQEALTNVNKHSQSARVRVELGRRKGRVHLEVRDWGVGFVPSNAPRDINGLRGMSERARIAGGTCEIESNPGQGTRVVVDLPFLSRKDESARC